MGTVHNGALMSIVKSYTCIVTRNAHRPEFSGTSHPIIRNKKNMAFPTSHGSRIVSVPFEINISAILQKKKNVNNIHKRRLPADNSARFHATANEIR